MVLRETQGHQAPKGTPELEDLLVSQAPWAQREQRECLHTVVRPVPEVPPERQEPEAPLGHRVLRDPRELGGTQEPQVLLAQRAQQ